MVLCGLALHTLAGCAADVETVGQFVSTSDVVMIDVAEPVDVQGAPDGVVCGRREDDHEYGDDDHDGHDDHQEPGDDENDNANPRRYPRNAQGQIRRMCWPRNFGEQFVASRVHLNTIGVKIADGAGVRVRTGLPVRVMSAARGDDRDRLRWCEGNHAIVDRDVGRIQALFRSTPGATAVAMIREGREAAEAQMRLDAEQSRGSEYEDRASMFYVVLPSENEAQARQWMRSLRQIGIVEYAYLEPIGSEPQAAGRCVDHDPPTGSSINPTQQTWARPPALAIGYQRDNIAQLIPSGLDFDFPQTLSAGRGRGVTVVDVEGGYHFGHEDLPTVTLVGGINSFGISAQVEHGTAVLGVLGACRNDYGITGIVSDATLRFSSVVFPQPILPYSVSAAITNAEFFGPLPAPSGLVILIEQQLTDFSISNCWATPSCGALCQEWVPVERYPIPHATIRGAVAHGHYVVEAAGNGGRFLDGFREPSLHRLPPLDPNNSGAIMVGNVISFATINGEHPTNCGNLSNAGERIDLSAWGDSSVRTTGFGPTAAAGQQIVAGPPDDVDQWYTTGFNGTSSASAMVAGAVASLSGLSLAMNNSLAPGPAAYLQRTGLQQSPLQSFRAGPTIQLGMAAAAFADRPIGTAGLALIPSLSRMTSAVKARNTVFVTAMDQQGLHWHNVLRAGNWYGWRSMRGVGSFDNPTTLGDIKLLSFDEVGGGLGAYSIGQLPLNQGFGTVVYESLRLDLDPRATFTEWQPVFASNTQMRQIVPIVFERGFADLFAVTALGNVRWFRRPAGTLVWTEQALNSRGILPVTGQIAVVRTAGEGVVLYSVHSTGVMYSALYSGGTWFSWRPVLQDAVAINDVHAFAVAKIAPQTTIIAAIRSDEGGRISVRTVVNGTPFNPFRVRPCYDLGFASEQSDVVVSPNDTTT